MRVSCASAGSLVSSGLFAFHSCLPALHQVSEYMEGIMRIVESRMMQM